MQTILAVDDENSVLQSYRMILSDRYKLVLVENGRRALDVINETHVDVMLLDLTMPGISGLDVLDELAARDEKLPVIVVTALNSVEGAVEAMKRGAREYIIKPFNVDQILLAVEKLLAESRAHLELDALREERARESTQLIGGSPEFRAALDIAQRAMQTDSTLLITGESGTGKDMLARYIHAGGRRAEHPFVHVSCCAIPPQLVESELFGHERGAFTGAHERRIGKIHIADRGSVFLDEIGEMPLDAQSKLLRVIQDGQFYPVGSTKSIEVDVRFICATNRDLTEAVKRGTFRQDLFYRINVIPIEMPPLRQRREDIPELALHFLRKHAQKANASTRGLSLQTQTSLAQYSWPGNIRELENIVQRLLVMNREKTIIEIEDLRGILPVEPKHDEADLSDLEGLTLDEATARVERHLIERALERSNHVQSQAAELLGTTRRILKYKMDQLEIAGGDGPANQTPSGETDQQAI
jgi:DNA-binding NtrC family response regulator